MHRRLFQEHLNRCANLLLAALPPVEYVDPLCRWLLVGGDCINSNTLDLTRQHLFDMLGKDLNQVGRAGLELQKSGLIRYAHGHTTILDRKDSKPSLASVLGLSESGPTNSLRV